VELEIVGNVKGDGMILDFGFVKKLFREYLDIGFDHRLLVYDADPIMESLAPKEKKEWGVVGVPFDPTVENVARLWGAWAAHRFGRHYGYTIKVWEASTNAATWRQDASIE
jgi:6-pyruvoyl-tetrahydropterin synthase